MREIGSSGPNTMVESEVEIVGEGRFPNGAHPGAEPRLRGGLVARADRSRGEIGVVGPRKDDVAMTPMFLGSRAGLAPLETRKGDEVGARGIAGARGLTCTTSRSVGRS